MDDIITFEQMQDLLDAVYEIYGKGRCCGIDGEGFRANSMSACLWHYVLGGFPYYMVKMAFAEHIEKSASVPIPCDIYRACLEISTEFERQKKENG